LYQLPQQRKANDIQFSCSWNSKNNLFPSFSFSEGGVKVHKKELNLNLISPTARNMFQSKERTDTKGRLTFFYLLMRNKKHLKSWIAKENERKSNHLCSIQRLEQSEEGDGEAEVAVSRNRRPV
jgi:hypothetical protein